MNFLGISADTWANGFATLVGALVGAMLAYIGQQKINKRTERQAELVAAHRLMFCVFQQINSIALIQKDQIYPEIQNPGRFISIPALPAFDLKKNILELPELTFLLQDSKSRSILYDFYLAQENYIEALHQWNLRSTFHLETLQPALAAAPFSNGSAVTSEIVRNHLGDQIYHHAVNSTDNCILVLQRAFEKLYPLKEIQRPYLIKRFGTNDFTDFDFPETWGLVKPESK